MDNVRKIVVSSIFIVPILGMQAADGISDGISAPASQGRLGLHLPHISLSVSHSQQPQISPISRLSFIPSENKEDDSTNKNAQNGMDSKINPSEEAVDQYFKKLEQEHPKEVANFLAKYLSLEKLCLALPYIVTMATDKADANPRILAANECLAVATAYFNVAFACTFNDPNGKKKNRKNLEASKKSKVEMLRESKFIKPKDLQVFQPYLKNRKKKKKR